MNVSSVNSLPIVAGARSAVEEATETAATTRAEAAKGDQQAVRRLAREEATRKLESPPANAVSKDGLDAVA